MSSPSSSTGCASVCGSAPLRICLLGLGEAGQAIGSDLVLGGAIVSGWDPRPTALAGAKIAASAAEAVAGTDIVMSMNSAASACDAAVAAVPELRSGQVYVDLNSGDRALKLRVARIVEPSGALFVDAALMGAVPRQGLRTPVLAAGPGAGLLAELLHPLGMPVMAISDRPGDAAVRKLLRSVFAKGQAAAAEEAIRAARLAGCEPWMREEIGRMLAAATEAHVERMIESSRLHASRRVTEMEAVRELLVELGVEPHITVSALTYLREMAADAALTTIVNWVQDGS